MSSILQSVRPGVKFARRPKRNPRDSWPAWTDERWTITEPEPCPIASPSEAEPTVRSEAWHNGFLRGYDLEAGAVPPDDWADEVKLSWWMGRNVGWLRREFDEATIDRLHSSSFEPCNALTDADIWPLGCVS